MTSFYLNYLFKDYLQIHTWSHNFEVLGIRLQIMNLFNFFINVILYCSKCSFKNTLSQCWA